MSYENVKLYFAKDNENKIITIDEVNEDNKNNTYLCPVCGSDLKPKATKSVKVSPHFAHFDSSKCNSESLIHWWFKNKLLEKGDNFTVISDKEKEYICKDVLVEQTYDTSSSIYRPDVTVLTECGNTIYFEMAFSNNKKIKDYLDIWLELKNVVVEIDIKTLMIKDKITTFKALFYDGKCFNVKRNDTYYNTIGKYKVDLLREETNVNKEIKERIRKLDWFWEDIFRYKKNEVDIECLALTIDSIVKEDRDIVFSVLNKQSCISIKNDYQEFKKAKSRQKSEEIIEVAKEFVSKEHDERLVHLIKDSDFYSNGYTYVIYENIENESYEVYDVCSYSKDYILGEIDYLSHKNNRFLIVKDYNDFTYQLIEGIKDNDLYKKFKNKISNYGFSIEVHVPEIRLSRENVNKEILNNKVPVQFRIRDKEEKLNKTINVKYDKSDSIDDLIYLAEEKTNKYLSNITPLKEPKVLMDDIFNLKRSYKNLIADFNVELSRYEWDEVIEIMINITDHSLSLIIDNYNVYNFTNKEEKIIEYKDRNKISSIVDEEIELWLAKISHRKCVVCKENFNINEGELAFFNKNEFSLPKRCKPCRKKRKNKGGVK